MTIKQLLAKIATRLGALCDALARFEQRFANGGQYPYGLDDGETLDTGLFAGEEMRNIHVEKQALVPDCSTGLPLKHFKFTVRDKHGRVLCGFSSTESQGSEWVQRLDDYIQACRRKAYNHARRAAVESIRRNMA
jgi:hypothetical protein